MTDDERWQLRRKMTRLHRRAQKAEGALAHERAKYKRLCDHVRKPGSHIPMLRSLIQSLSCAIAARGVRKMYGAESWNKDADANNVILQVLDSLHTVNHAIYGQWHDLLIKAPVPEKPKPKVRT